MKSFFPREEKGKIVAIEYLDGSRNLSELECEAKNQINEYLKATRKNFTFPFEIKGTEFQKKVYLETMKIPYGEVVTYKELAERIGKPKACRAIGNALNKNSLLFVVPCHRVVGQKGLVGFALGLPMKEKLINLEKENK